MELTWYGLSCFRLTERGHSTVVTDPYGSSTGLPNLKLKGDVVTISHDAAGHNHAAAVSGFNRLLSGPGEYEIGDVFITGIATHDKDPERRNVIFMFDYKGLTIAHLGDMAKVPSQTQIDALEQINVLLVPVGGGLSLNASQAAELVSMLEPEIVIPMHYSQPDLGIDLEPVEKFLAEMGVEQPEPLSSLKVTSGILSPETQIVLLEPKI